MTFMNLKIGSLLTALILVVGCNYNEQKKINDSDLFPEIQFKTGAELSYKQISEQVLEKRCFECHSNARGNKGKVNLETYQNVFANKEDIRNDLLDKSMPKDRPALSTYEARLVIAWIESGASEFAQEKPIIDEPTTPPVVAPPPQPPKSPPTPPVVVDPPAPVVVPEIPADQVDFAFITKYVLQTNCYKCHTEKAGNKGHVNLETYENVMKNYDDIQLDISTDQMPPAPPKGIPLTDEQARLILKWLDNGAPEKAKPASVDLSEIVIELEQVNK